MTTTVPHPSPSPAPAGEDDWSGREALAEALVPLVGRLFREHGVVTAIYGRSLVNKSTRKILKLHRFARHIDGQVLPIAQTLAIVEALDRLPLSPATIDIAELHRLHHATPAVSWEEFLRDQLASIIDTGDQPATTDVVLYGFGRIGRLVARLLIEKAGSGNGLRLRAIVVRKGGGRRTWSSAPRCCAATPSTAQFQGTITVDEANSTIIANGNEIKVDLRQRPAAVDYTAYGIKDAILIDNTGKWRDREGLSKHLRPGIDKVVLTAPGKGDVPNIVHGVNHDTIKPDEQILSCASCTTNAIVPPLKAMEDEYGVLRGHVETVHSFTNDQNLLDNYHKFRPPRPLGAAQHGHHRDRCRLRRRQGAARPQGEDHRQLDPRPGAGRLDRDPQPARSAARPPARRSSTTSATCR